MRATAARAQRGTMPLLEHLRELRKRLLLSMAAITAVATVAWQFYSQIFAFIRSPLDDAVASAARRGIDVTLSMTTMTDAFTLRLQVSAAVGIIVAAPYILFHVWRFVTPGLLAHEKRWAFSFLAAAVPLFAAGIAFAYVALPQALVVLLGFTPDKVSNIIPVPVYVAFLLRMLLVFGGAFVAPVLIVVLNLASLLPARAVFGRWRGIILGSALFGAIATPTGDPFNMMIVALPLMVLIFSAGLVCLMNEKVRGRKREQESELADDEPSTLA